MGAKEVKAARAALAATVATEVAKNGGPISEDNPAYQVANKRVNDAIAASSRAVRFWNGG